MTTKLTLKELEYLKTLVSEALFYKRSKKQLNEKEQTELYCNLKKIENESEV
jgi:hypothetical protein